jgi:hypothetical protein
MRRIVLEKKPQRPQLPNYTEIDQKEIREAAAAWDAEKAALDEAKKSLDDLEQKLPQAQEEDATADARLRSEGKPKLKGLPATQRHEKAIAEADHEQRVAVRLEEDAFDALQTALDEHADEWVESIEQDVQSLDGEWAAAINTLIELHARRSSALAIQAMVVGGEQASATAVGFRPSQIRGIDFASHTAKQTGYVTADDVFATLAALGIPEPVVEASPQEHASPVRPGGSPMTRDYATVEDEIAERREFAEHASSSEGREQATEARRQRAELNRQAGEEALQASLEG